MNAIKDKVVVITGASSGIGRATALEFASSGAKVVISARDADALRETKEELEKTGADILAVIADVTEEEQVERLARRAEEAYQHIDVWINNAAVAMFAKFDESPSDDYRQVIETDFFGYVYGARAALRRFKAQRHGLIINVDSVEGIAPKPYHSAYSAAKHAVRALSSSLRMELALDGLKDIHIATVMPGIIDTPLFAHAANYTGQSVQAPETSTPPSVVARAICGLVIKPQRELVLGNNAKRSIMQYLLTPRRYEQRGGRKFERLQLGNDETMPGQGNLYDPRGPHAILGGWSQPQPETMKKLTPWLALAGTIVAVGSLATWLLWPGQKRLGKLMKQNG